MLSVRAGAGLLLYLLLLAVAFGQMHPVPSLTSRAADNLRLVAFTPEQVVFEFVPGEPGFENGRLQLAGTDRLSAPGEPDLPAREVLVGLPQEGTVRLSATAFATAEFRDHDVPPAPGFSASAATAPARLQTAGLWPEQPAELVAIENLRGIRVARVRLNPAQFSAAERLLRVHRRIVVTLRFARPPRRVDRPDPLDDLIAGMLVNGSEARNWKLPFANPDSINFFARSPFWCRIKIETTGVYRITPADLNRAGFSAGVIDPRTLRLYSLGRYTVNESYPDTMVELPVYVKGEEDGRFDANDYLAFYAEAPARWNDSLTRWQPNFFTRHTVVWLTWGTEPGRRMAQVSGSGATAPTRVAGNRVRLEEELLCPARSGLLWVWEKYFKEAGRASAQYYRPLALPERDTIQRISVNLYGFTARTEEVFRAVLTLNRVLLDTVRITARNQGAPANVFRFDTLPAAAVARAGLGDSLGIELIGDPEVNLYLDYVDVGYRERLKLAAATALEFHQAGGGEFAIEGATGDVLILDVSDPFQPRQIVGSEVSGSERRFRLTADGLVRICAVPASRLRTPVKVEKREPGKLRTPTEQADYYIVCPDEFLPAAKLLAQYRERNVAGLPGARARAVALGDIYDDYTFGMEEPGGIKKFFRSKRPAYGLLAGDATYDYKNNLKLEKPPGVPAYEVGFDLDPEVYGGIAKAQDAWYADFDGDGRSPDMILGRITVRSPLELRRFLDKVRNYETQPPGLWAKRVILLADDEFLGDPKRPDGIGFDHITGGCEAMAGIAARLLDLAKVYLTEYPLEAINSKPRAAAELLSQLNTGALLWFFYGHGAGFQLNHERTLHIDNVGQVRNGSRQPLAFYGSCGVGRFEDTRYEAIAEELVRQEEGCIATMGASKATYPSSNNTFGRLLLNYLLDHPEQAVGPAFYTAWVNANTLYHFFGDPGTRLRLPAAGPDVAVVPETLYPGRRTAFSDTMPATAGRFEAAAFELSRQRYYSSSQGSVSYLLPGTTLFRGPGTFADGRLEGGFTVPALAYPDTVIVPNGTYIRLPNTGRVSLLAWSDTLAWGCFSAGLALADSPPPGADSAPPQLELFADHIRLSPTDTTIVPKRFGLMGRLFDESGILLASGTDYGLSFFVSDRTARVELANHFSYDLNSATTGQFRHPVELQKSRDSVVVTVSDNLLNRRIVTCRLKTDLGEGLRIDSCLVYPNPSSGPTRFTFLLSAPALVSVKIYSISGRLVSSIEPQPCQFGYNQIEWDGNDHDGQPLPNGIYLFKLDARSAQTSTGMFRGASASVRDKLIVRR
uniref:T9SS type A sorting domain-containing protein n=1 Tax=candidate division WOR-3 bacterium TaxID=2052148 RepID=A0A7C4GGC4_UNCW3